MRAAASTRAALALALLAALLAAAPARAAPRRLLGRELASWWSSALPVADSGLPSPGRTGHWDGYGIGDALPAGPPAPAARILTDAPATPAPTAFDVVAAAPNGSAAAACPEITLRLNAIEVYSSVVAAPEGELEVRCYRRGGGAGEPPVRFAAADATARGPGGARYAPSAPAARLTCGDAVTCRVRAAPVPGGPWVEVADGGCWFDYRHFTQLAYREPLAAWTCNKPPVRYTLECIECGSPTFDWDAALAGAGPPLEEGGGGGVGPFSSVMVIVAVSVVSLAVVAAALALVARGRRRAALADARVTELIRRVETERGRRAARPAHKPPAMFEVGAPAGGPAAAGYAGPIVVLHCGAREGGGGGGAEDGGELPNVAIALPDRTGGDEDEEGAVEEALRGEGDAGEASASGAGEGDAGAGGSGSGASSEDGGGGGGARRARRGGYS